MNYHDCQEERTGRRQCLCGDAGWREHLILLKKRKKMTTGNANNGAAGIGKQIAITLAEKGYDIAVNYHTDRRRQSLPRGGVLGARTWLFMRICQG